jgi:hypothetical protein
MSDLTKFSLVANQFNIYIDCVNLNGEDDYAFKVVIFNFNDKVAFELPLSRSYNKVESLADKVAAKGIVNLTKWGASDLLDYVQIDDITEGFKELHTQNEVLEEPQECDGSEAYGAMLEQQAQEHVNMCEELHGRY